MPEENTEAIELLRQIAADTRATREAIERQVGKPEEFAKIVAGYVSGSARADYARLVAPGA